MVKEISIFYRYHEHFEECPFLVRAVLLKLSSRYLNIKGELGEKHIIGLYESS